MPRYEFSAYVMVYADSPEEAETIFDAYDLADERIAIELDESPPIEIDEDEEE